MRVPEFISTRVRSKDGTPVEGLIVTLRVSAGTKNPYLIHFPKTDQSGEARLTREDFVGQFTDHWESGLMDYNGTVEQAGPVVQASLFDPTWSLENPALAFAWPLLAHERTKWSSRREEYEYRVSCRNLHYVGPVVDADLHSTSRIDLEVDLRESAGGAT
jgi:hypothetical protein